MAKITLTINEIPQVFSILRDVLDVNEQPFVGQAKRLLFKLQPEIEYIQKCDKEDLESIKDKELNFGDKIAPPEHFPSEYSPILEKVCNKLPEKKSQIEGLLDKKDKKD